VQEGSGFHPLPVVDNSTDRDATDVKKYVTRWRTYNVTAESSTTEREWRERQAAVRTATQVCSGLCPQTLKPNSREKRLALSQSLANVLALQG